MADRRAEQDGWGLPAFRVPSCTHPPWRAWGWRPYGKTCQHTGSKSTCFAIGAEVAALTAGKAFIRYLPHIASLPHGTFGFRWVGTNGTSNGEDSACRGR